jgi:uncharacterized radical SAM superfamily protein
MEVKRTVHFYYPGQGFPSVSVTGNECSLDCKHCGGHYLKHMVDGSTPEQLLEFINSRKDVSGFLLSGGCNPAGTVDFSSHLNTIRRITSETELVLNVHTGMIDLETAKKLKEAGIDLASVDIVGDADVMKEVYGMTSLINPVDCLKTLREVGFSTIVPHVCIGLLGGQLSHEFKALEKIDEAGIEPDGIVFISLIPTKGTDYEGRDAPSPEDVFSVMSYGRKLFPETPLLLGCMRSKKERETEIAALDAGADGIVLPSKETKEWVIENGFKVQEHNTCCALLGIEKD